MRIVAIIIQPPRELDAVPSLFNRTLVAWSDNRRISLASILCFPFTSWWVGGNPPTWLPARGLGWPSPSVPFPNRCETRRADRRPDRRHRGPQAGADSGEWGSIGTTERWTSCGARRA